MANLNSVEQAAQKLGLAVSTLDKWRVSGRGPQFVRLGRRIAYRDEDIEAFIAQGVRWSTSDTGEATPALGTQPCTLA